MLLSALPCGSAGNGDFAMKWSTRRGRQAQTHLQVTMFVTACGVPCHCSWWVKICENGERSVDMLVCCKKSVACATKKMPLA